MFDNKTIDKIKYCNIIYMYNINTYSSYKIYCTGIYIKISTTKKRKHDTANSKV